jgi:hypothetical protein
MMSVIKAANVATPPSLFPHLLLPPRGVWMWSVLHFPRIKPGMPNSFNGDRAKECVFLTSLELYLSLTGLDFPDDQTCIHWALFYFKSGHATTFAKCVVRQEMKGG